MQTFLILLAVSLPLPLAILRPATAQDLPTPSALSVPLAPGLLEDAAPISPTYLLGAGDEVQITVFGFEEYTGTQVILPDGTISLPVLNRVLAAGKTVEDLRQELTQELNRLLVDPVVEVRLTRLRPITVTVAGEVQRPGPIQLAGIMPSTQASEEMPLPTLSAALAMAGGVQEDADISQVTLRRQISNGQWQVYTLNLWEGITSDQGFSDVLLRDNDTVFVPAGATNDPSQRSIVLRSTFAPAEIKVRVVGEVTRPGEVILEPTSTIASAIAIAGGPTDKANLKKALLVRLGEDGNIYRETINLQDLANPLPVRDGDVVIVPKSGTRAFLDTFSTVLSPLIPISVFLRLF